MKLLLDTQAILWWLRGDRVLGPTARRAIERDALMVWISAASVWEMAIKNAARRLELNEALARVVTRATDDTGFQPLSINSRHALSAGALPPHHRDPFDRMLIAQAQLEDLTIVTSDAAFKAYDVRLLDALV